MLKNLLEISHLEKYYGNKGNITKAVDGLDLSVSEGEFIAIMGASGSGKTTLLNCISTIDTVTAGQIKINDQDITKLKSKQLAKFRRDELGFVFQEYNLLDTLTAFENIALALTIQRIDSVEIKRRIQDIVKVLELADVMTKYPYEMSGGQRQRVACARAVVSRPSLILADEPTGALDSKAAKNLMNTFLKLNRDLGSTVMMVTHDSLTASYANRVVFLKDGKLFTEIQKGVDARNTFFKRIIEVVTLLGGDINEHD